MDLYGSNGNSKKGSDSEINSKDTANRTLETTGCEKERKKKGTKVFDLCIIKEKEPFNEILKTRGRADMPTRLQIQFGAVLSLRCL